MREFNIIFLMGSRALSPLCVVCFLFKGFYLVFWNIKVLSFMHEFLFGSNVNKSVCVVCFWEKVRI